RSMMLCAPEAFGPRKAWKSESCPETKTLPAVATDDANTRQAAASRDRTVLLLMAGTLTPLVEPFFFPRTPRGRNRNQSKPRSAPIHGSPRRTAEAWGQGDRAWRGVERPPRGRVRIGNQP